MRLLRHNIIQKLKWLQYFTVYIQLLSRHITLLYIYRSLLPTIQTHHLSNYAVVTFWSKQMLLTTYICYFDIIRLTICILLFYLLLLYLQYYFRYIKNFIHSAMSHFPNHPAFLLEDNSGIFLLPR